MHFLGKKCNLKLAQFKKKSSTFAVSYINKENRTFDTWNETDM